MKSAVDDDDTGWGLGIPEKMKNNANWVDITHEFKGACKGKLPVSDKLIVCMTIVEAVWPWCLLPFPYTELNLGELLHDKLWVTIHN